MIENLFFVIKLLALLLVVGILLGSVAWAWLEALDKIVRWFKVHRNLCEYMAHRDRFKFWLARVKGEKPALNRSRA